MSAQEVALDHPPLVVVMGVSGCGKSSVGALLAERLGVDFLEDDDLHAPASISTMAAGESIGCW